MDRIAIVLAGGRSSRLGRDKAALPFGGGTLLDRVIERAAAVAPCLVVAGEHTPAPRSNAVRVVADPPDVRFAGPLAGFVTGLRAAGTVRCALLLGCDSPFLAPALLEHLASRLERDESVDAVVPRIDDHDHPLVAAYSSSALATAERALAAGERSLRSLLVMLRVAHPTAADLRAFDPELRSFLDVDTPADLDRARTIERANAHGPDRS